MVKVLIVGQGGRESSIAMRLAEDASVFAVMAHKNPTIEHFVQSSGGRYLIATPTDSDAISNFAEQNSIDLAFVSSDEPLAAGVVDALLAKGIRTVGPTRAGAQIEWDKEYAMNLMAQQFPAVTPKFWVVHDTSSLSMAIAEVRLSGLDIVVKPQGLTGGKGVKVMGAHLQDLDAAHRYAQELLAERPSESVVLMEKVDGVEFTIMILTDGVSVVGAPATYDYPYRFEGDSGPGTGGMGAFSNSDQPLPFMSQAHYDECLDVAKGILKAMKEDGRRFNGVLNAGFFITKNGIKFLEFNARFGDPECMNIMTSIDSSLLALLEDIEAQKLTEQSVKFSGQATVVKYLVTPEYALEPGKKHDFSIDVGAIESKGLHVFFSAAVRNDAGGFSTVGNSRCVAIAARGNTIPSAAALVESAIQQYFSGPLQWREDVGAESYIDGLLRQQ